MKISNVIVLLTLAPAIAGCGSTSSTPSGPSPVVQRNQAGSTLVYGYVADTLLRPLAGVKVEVLDGPQTGAVVTSDATGQFQMTGVFDDSTRFRASKTDFVTVTAGLNPKCPVCNGRSLTVYLELPTPPVGIAGDYALTLTADSSCATIPEDVRTRTYAVTVAPELGINGGAKSVFRATVSGAAFLQYYDSFEIGVAGNDVALEFRGDGPLLLEEVAKYRYVAFDGRADARVGASIVSTITAPFNGTIDYCELNADIGAYYNCPAGAIANAHCTSANHRLTLTRR